MPALDLKGCIEDSPVFRRRIAAHEESISNFDTSLKSLVKLVKSQLDLSTEFSQRQSQIAVEFNTIASGQDDPIVGHALDKFAKSLTEVEKCRNLMNTHISSMFLEPLEQFIRAELAPVKELKKKFERSSDDVDSSLVKYMSKKPKDQMIAEASRDLYENRLKFQADYMEYVMKLNEVEAKKKFDFVENILGYMYTSSVFHHQGYEILKDLEPYMRDLTGLLQDSRQRYSEELEEGQKYQSECFQTMVENGKLSTEDKSRTSSMSSGRTTSNDMVPKAQGPVSKSGYLFERRSGRMLQSWTRRYYTIDGEDLVATTRNPKMGREEDQATSMNLRVCSIRVADGYDRRFCFEIISPSRVTVLQAENEQDVLDWVNSLKMVNQLALNSDKTLASSFRIFGGGKKPISDTKFDNKPLPMTSEPSTEGDKALFKQVRNMPGNNFCADCRAADPDWASINLGTLLCIECSGIHRSLGVHVSKVRSVTLDKWETESIEIMLLLGNVKTNEIFEARLLSEQQDRPVNPASSRAEKTAFITDKYVHKKYIAETSEEEAEGLNEQFWKAIKNPNLHTALRCLALGANINYRNPDEKLYTGLHVAVLQEDIIAVEFLLQWFCDVDEKDDDGWTALHLAAAENNVRFVLTLLKRHAKPDIKSNAGKTALDIAVDQQHVQAVTALRLFAFDKQHNASPASSSDFGFREAMSSFKSSPLESRNSSASHSALDLRTTVTTNSNLSAVEKTSILNDDQNSSLLRPSG
ncbi:hypothetical protein K450DRAFT_262065 [Umbelopsis ramanniana AG]|uniref:ArfGap-domain-containing protein n=1 Tax=Umbelopsis ramanniana AG TaxID=1314678 RepID=A0AAD5HAQ7_UMBRA|nr:uncharacterized protein K450DRAFT_262065 [Umbelopsis ramanniana AG]KAI8575403.1 hypothetical protein K450DRAFT_262065 [Umbelopsis ramanniana AG]